MEPIKKRSELYQKIRNLVEGIEEVPYPTIIEYCEGIGKPLFTFTVVKKQEDHFIDKNGQKWIKAPE
jgi:hypothetical protein